MADKFIPDRIIPPGVNDARSRALMAAYSSELERVDLKSLLVNNAMTVDAKLLPAMTVARTMTDFMWPGLREENVRKLLHNYREIHAKSGYISGVRMGLSALDVSVTWVQWWQEEPKAHHNTHKVSVFFGDVLFDDSALGDHKHRNAVTRIIDLTKRWSQSIAITFGVQTKSTLFMGAFSSYAARYVAALPASDQESHPVNLLIGVASSYGGTHKAGMENS